MNDETTRSFLTLPTATCDDSEHASSHTTTTGGVLRLISAVDEVLVKYGCPAYYENPRIHVSIASCKEDIRTFISRHDKREDNGLDQQEEPLNTNSNDDCSIPFMVRGI